MTAQHYTVRGRAEIGEECWHCDGRGTLWREIEVEEIVELDDEALVEEVADAGPANSVHSVQLAEQALDDYAQRHDCTDWRWLRPPEIAIGAQPSPARVMAASGAASLFDLPGARLPEAVDRPHTTATPWRCQPADPIPAPGYAYQVSAAGPTPWPVALAVMPADARLITAAPDLLRCCRRVLAELEADQNKAHTAPPEVLKTWLRNAIAQAADEEVQP